MDGVDPARFRARIEAECDALSSLGSDLTDRQAWTDANAQEVPSLIDQRDKGGSHFSLTRLEQLAALFVDFAGSSYLIGTPEGCQLSLGSRQPQNVILLTWDLDHVAGLVGICRKGSQCEPVKIWSSDWIIEAVRNNPETEAIWRRISKLIKKGTVQLRPCPSFEQEHREQIRPGISLTFRYEVARTPRLQAQFELFSHRLIVRKDESVPRIAEIEVERYRTTCIEHSYRKSPEAKAQLHTTFQHRLGELSNEKGADEELARSADSNWPTTVFISALSTGRIVRLAEAPGETNRFPDLTPPEISQNGFTLPPEGCEDESSWNRIHVLPGCPTLRASMVADEELCYSQGHDSISEKSRIFAAIACGGLSTASSGLIHPARQVMLENKRMVSLLGFKLLDYHLDQTNPHEHRYFQPTLLLIVSAWTEASVREEVARFREMWTPTPTWKVQYLRQTLMPRYQKKVGKITIYRDPLDGHLQYRPAGHFDSLRLFLSTEFSPFEGETFIYFTNYNNIGRNLTREVLQLANYLDRPEHGNVPIVFELMRNPVAELESYWVSVGNDPKCNRLIKPTYLGMASLSEVLKGSRDPSDQEELIVSTGSFLLSRDRLMTTRHQLEEVPFFVRSEIPAPSADEEAELLEPIEWLNFERDIDQVTWLHSSCDSQSRCHGIEFKAQTELSRMRYLPIKKPKDLYEVNFGKVEDLYRDVSWRLTPKDRKEPLRPLHLLPVEFHAPWGGGRIRHLKNMPPSDLPVSETWEFSSYPRGVSMAYDSDPLHPLPLPYYLKDEAGTILSPDVMVKLLDCNDWLSIQVHPSQETCSRIHRALEARNGPTEEFQELWNGIRARAALDGCNELEQELSETLLDKEDDLGKDELFYVISEERSSQKEIVVTRGSPYILGFEAGKVRGLSGFLDDKSSGLDWDLLLGESRTYDDICALVLRHCRPLKLRFVREFLNEVETPRYREELLKQENQALLKKVFRSYRAELRRRIKNWLTPILALRSATSAKELDGIVLILAIQALNHGIEASMPLSSGISRLRSCITGALYRDQESPLLRCFHQIDGPRPREPESGRPLGLRGLFVWVRAGMIHAAGSGLYMVEASHPSNNTFRVLDRGRELATNRRDMHHTLAAIALSENSFLDAKSERRFVFDSSGSPAPTGLIQMQAFGPSELAGQGTVALAFEHGGCVVICTRGSLHVDLKYSAESKVEKSFHVGLSNSQSIFVVPARAEGRCELSLRSERYSDDAECVVVSVKDVEQPPVLCLSVFGTHTEFAYYKYPLPPIIKSYSWDVILGISDTGASSNWPSKREALINRIRSFVSVECHLSNKDSCLLRISWPNQLDEAMTDTRLHLVALSSIDDTVGKLLEIGPRELLSEAAEGKPHSVSSPHTSTETGVATDALPLQPEAEARTAKVLEDLRRRRPRDLTEYRLTRIAEWSQHRYQLDNRFTELTLLIDQGEDAPGGRWAQRVGRARFNDLRNVLDELPESPVFALIGAPGSGKSTLIRRLELDLSLASLRPKVDAVPFFVSLNAYSANSGSPHDFLRTEWSKLGPSLPKFDLLLESGKFLLLLDAINEIPHTSTADYHGRVRRWAEFSKLIAAYGNRAIFTCRSLDYSASLSSKDLRVPQVVVQPMSDEQIRAFLGVYVPRDMESVWNHLRGSPQLEVARLPFFLNLICEHVGTSLGMPQGRVALIAGFIRRALCREIGAGNHLLMPGELLDERDHLKLTRNKWRSSSELPLRGSLIPSLSRLAYTMQERGCSVEVAQIRAEYDDALEYIGGKRASDVIDVGAALAVLDEDLENGEVLFAHQLFQEFFAAHELAAKPNSNKVRTEWQVGRVTPSLQETVASLASGDPLPPLPQNGWEESTFLASTIAKDPEAFVRELISANLPLAARCAASTEVSVPESLKNEIRSMLLFRMADVATDLRARIAAGLMLGNLGDPRFERRMGPSGDYLMPPMVPIGRGDYPIGSGDNEEESPAHTVRVKSFRLGVFPVTNAEYALFVASRGYEDERWWLSDAARAWRSGESTAEASRQQQRSNRKTFQSWSEDYIVAGVDQGMWTSADAEHYVSLRNMSDVEFDAWLNEGYPAGRRYTEPEFWHDEPFCNPSQPVVGVSWYEAQAYCGWLSEQTGIGFRLPTEVELESAARGPNGREFSYGNKFDNSLCNTFSSHVRRPTPVGAFRNATPEGIYDLTGNIWCWSSSLFERYPYDAIDGRERSDLGGRRAGRGGSWLDGWNVARASSRYLSHFPGTRFNVIGFRLAATG